MKKGIVYVLVCMLILLFVGVIIVPSINASISIPCHSSSGTPASDFTIDPGTISGHVTDTAMNPIEGARVKVYFHNTSRETYSDASGYYHVTDIPLCYCMKNATCSKEGYVLVWVYLSITENTTHDFILPSKGDWLYVGGSGPGNYTRIQDAINASNNGDTIFVYHGTYPENIIVEKSLNLLGESKLSTLIDGTGKEGNGINISADNVTVSSFTIRNYTSGLGISLSKNKTRIIDTIISDNMVGIETYYGIPFEPAFLNNGHNIIEDNLIIRNEGCGIGLEGQNNTIIRNSISQSQYGIFLAGGESNNISLNNISDNEIGIFNVISYQLMIYRNTISKNTKLGISNYCTSSTFIRQNNFIENEQNAYFNHPLKTQCRILKKIFGFPLHRSVWEQNYWNTPRIFPYMIPGLVSFLHAPIIEPPFIHNFFQIDWHPAQQPYDIPGMK